MRKLFRLFVLGTIVSSVASPTLHACGDKLLSMGRGVRLHPTASFLVYRSRTSTGPSSVNDPALTGLLKHDGHALRMAENVEQLADILKKFKIDAVLVDASDETTVRRYVESAPSRPKLYVLPSARAPRSHYIALVQTFLLSKQK